MDEFNFTSWLAGQANILNNLANSLGPINVLLGGVAYLLGLVFAFKAIMSLKVYGEARTMMSNHGSIKEPLVYIMIAAVFIYAPTSLKVIMNTTFGYDSVLSYAPTDSSNGTIDTLFGSGSLVGRPLTLLIQTMGIIAFIRGWVMIGKSAATGQPPGGTGKGLMHVFGGIMAMNIVGTLQIINNTLYRTG